MISYTYAPPPFNQIGITDDWVQCRNIAEAFRPSSDGAEGGRLSLGNVTDDGSNSTTPELLESRHQKGGAERQRRRTKKEGKGALPPYLQASLGPASASLLCKRLAALLAATKARVNMSPLEGRDFIAFCRYEWTAGCEKRAVEPAECPLNISSHPPHVSLDRQLFRSVLPPMVSRMTAQHIGWVTYAMACLEVDPDLGLAGDAGGDRPGSGAAGDLAGRLVDRAEDLMRSQLRQRGGGAARWRGAAVGGSGGPGASAAYEDAEVVEFVAADYASLVWGLGTLGHRPSDAWLDALCR